eukprot:TRINITY_DN1628_c1_g1_i2.p1 TRINITY_DN1628_c1_g1~~TRINITY_DN1628_c1_g1_i2.p1  ORF type:complete len:115 (+),score=11.32 TRINITY_DN1628_c1_g1_i2:248-592(+)
MIMISFYGSLRWKGDSMTDSNSQKSINNNQRTTNRLWVTPIAGTTPSKCSRLGEEIHFKSLNDKMISSPIAFCTVTISDLPSSYAARSLLATPLSSFNCMSALIDLPSEVIKDR